jgi:hypothetical protein
MVTALGFGKPTDKDMLTPEKKKSLEGASACAPVSLARIFHLTRRLTH